MKYENAKFILPTHLLEELQKYAAGKLIYIPSGEKRKGWGESSGYRNALRERNRKIRIDFAEGATAEELADRYYLTPETIRKIVYSKKEKNIMELESVFALYSDTPPDNYETVYEDEWDKEWGSGYLREIVADFGGRKMVICIDDYTYTTHEYVRQWKETADNYRSIGCICPDLVKNKYGELSYGIRFCGRDCVVFAEEYPALPIAAESDLSIRTVSGRYLFHDDMLRMTAKIAALHIDTLPLSSATALFDPVTSGYYKDYEDWITEGFADFKEWALTHYPDQTQKIGTIEELFTENRSKLAEIYGKLPVSVFHGSETPPCILIDPDGNFAGFKEFRGGGRDTCVNHFVHLLNFLTEHLPDTYELDEISDPKLRKKRFDGIKRDLALIREHYTFTEDEIAVFPLLMRDRIINTYWFKDIIDKWASADENRIVQLFDYIIERFTSDPIDYKSILR